MHGQSIGTNPVYFLTSVSTCNSAWNECINLWSHSSALREQRVSIIMSPAVPSCLASLRWINACKKDIYIHNHYNLALQLMITLTNIWPNSFQVILYYRSVDKWWHLVTNMENHLTTIFTRATNLMYCLEDYLTS